ncbi:MAG: uroporphyrinogen decarboxylase family protein [candidate division WOR-3 bacterium]|nr:uroporphyrinogen decarboxylase family protein [candidate division WOR-3 bacterium]
MNSKERVKTTFKHREPDRVPVFDLGVNEPLGTKILGRKALVSTGGSVWQRRAEMLLEDKRDELVEQYARDTIDLYRKLEFDILVIDPHERKNYFKPKRTSEYTWRYDFGDRWWTTYEYFPEQDLFCERSSNIAEGGIEEFKRVVNIMEKQPEAKVDPTQFEALKIAIEEAEEDMFVIGHADIMLPTFTSWFPVFLEAMIVDPPLVKAYLELANKSLIPDLTYQLEMGVDGMHGRMDFCGKNGPVFSPTHFKEFVQPYLKRITETCHKYSVPFFKHMDGNIKPIADEVLLKTGIDGYHSIEPPAGMDIGEIKRKYGEKITLLGNVDAAGVLVFGTPDEVKNATKEVIKIAAPGGGFVLASSNCFHGQIPLENLYAMLEAAREYGNYPINL